MAGPGGIDWGIEMVQRIAAAAAICCVFNTSLIAQEAGQITGAVSDSSGAVIVNATVRATEIKTGFVRTTVTGSDGLYAFPGLRPAGYEIVAETSGFRSFRRSGLELLASQSLTLNITLDVGAVTERPCRSTRPMQH